ncbi:hypothetical protein GCM10011399_12980 [Subtercola lobariae]|uniref:LysR substrate-binding domain-containing protein n=1 Tax=Subtercola lobariae TaxID=1588641 RepID=A0A917B694_9MICO|nr:hypothetical protein GCM10011399_12980 [Subtercola lobariae]
MSDPEHPAEPSILRTTAPSVAVDRVAPEPSAAVDRVPAASEAPAAAAETAQEEAAQEKADKSEPPAAEFALSVAFTVGVTVTKWSRVWAERHPELPLKVFRSEPGEQTTVLQTGAADVSFVRHPFDRGGLSAIALYSEVPVVGVAKDHPASVFDVVAVDDLQGEHLLQDPDEVPEWRDIATEVTDGSRRPLRGIHSREDAVEQVAAGVGIVILPQSISRLHNRKDVVFRPVSGVAETQVSVAWRAGDESVLVEEFIGIVRGRSASSSRSRSGVVGAAAGTATGLRTGSDAGTAAAPAKKIGPVAKAKAKARAAKEAEAAAAGRKGTAPRPAQSKKKTQSDQANAAQARRRKFGGKR